MPQENKPEEKVTTEEVITNENESKTPQSGSGDDELVARLVAERIAEELRPIKEKLDKAYETRDAALKKVEEAAKKEREAQLALLKEEGKHKEAYEIEIAEERAKRVAAETRNVELTRDSEVRAALGAHPFRNEKAADMAFREILPTLVQNEQGQWVHRSGVSVRDFVKTFADDENNTFLLRPKTSSGTGTPTVKSSAPSNEKVSLFALSQDEVLKRAREGKLR